MWEWFEHYWSSVGLGAAIVLLLLLFCTSTFVTTLACHAGATRCGWPG